MNKALPALTELSLLWRQIHKQTVKDVGKCTDNMLGIRDAEAEWHPSREEERRWAWKLTESDN